MLLPALKGSVVFVVHIPSGPHYPFFHQLSSPEIVVQRLL